MMDNVVSADEEFADIVKSKGGKTLLKAVLKIMGLLIKQCQQMWFSHKQHRLYSG